MILLTMSSVCFSCLGLCYDAAAPVVCLFLCLGLCYDASPARLFVFAPGSRVDDVAAK